MTFFQFNSHTIIIALLVLVNSWMQSVASSIHFKCNPIFHLKYISVRVCVRVQRKRLGDEDCSKEDLVTLMFED